MINRCSQSDVVFNISNGLFFAIQDVNVASIGGVESVEVFQGWNLAKSIKYLSISPSMFGSASHINELHAPPK